MCFTVSVVKIGCLVCREGSQNAMQTSMTTMTDVMVQIHLDSDANRIGPETPLVHS